MEGTGADNAMVETALALAMAFFAIMVLAMVSMGVPPGPEVGSSDALALAEATSSAAPEADGTRADDERTLIVHHAGRFLDTRLQPVEPDVLEGPLTLAIAPSLPLREALALRTALAHRDVLVTTLDERWLTQLEEMQP